MVGGFAFGAELCCVTDESRQPSDYVRCIDHEFASAFV